MTAAGYGYSTPSSKHTSGLAGAAKASFNPPPLFIKKNKGSKKKNLKKQLIPSLTKRLHSEQEHLSSRIALINEYSESLKEFGRDQDLCYLPDAPFKVKTLSKNLETLNEDISRDTQRVFETTVGVYGADYSKGSLEELIDCEDPVGSTCKILNDRAGKSGYFKHPKEKAALASSLKESYSQYLDSLSDLEYFIESLELNERGLAKPSKWSHKLQSLEEKTLAYQKKTQDLDEAFSSAVSGGLKDFDPEKITELKASAEELHDTISRLRESGLGVDLLSARWNTPLHSDNIVHQFIKRAHDKHGDLTQIKKEAIKTLKVIIEISENLDSPDFPLEEISKTHTESMKEGAHTVLSILLPVSLLWSAEGQQKGFLYKESIEPSLIGLQNKVDSFENSVETLLQDIQKLSRYESNLRIFQETLKNNNTAEGSYNTLISDISSKRDSVKKCIDELARIHSKSHVLLKASEAMVKCEYFHHFNKRDVENYCREIKNEDPVKKTHQTIGDLVKYLEGSDKDWIVIKSQPPKATCANAGDKLSLKQSLRNKLSLLMAG